MILLIDLGTKNIHSLYDKIDEYMDVEQVGIYDLVKKEDFSRYQGIVISTTTLVVSAQPYQMYLEALKPIFELEKPILAIGIAHHLMGLYFGAQPTYQSYRNEQTIISTVDDVALFDKLPLEITMINDHAASISVPPKFSLIGSSDACINEAMQHETLPYYGIQFLPERSGNHGSIILDNFTRIVQQQTKTA